MKPAGLLPLGGLFAGLSLISVGGANVLIPSIRRGVVDQYGWLDQPSFAHLFAISQIAPGPNVMLSSAIGWRVAGPMGLLVATVAILLPSSILTILVGRLMRHSAQARWPTIATDALVPLALGLMIASGLVAARTAGAGVVGYAISCGAAAVVCFSKLNPLIVIAVGTAMFVLSRWVG